MEGFIDIGSYAGQACAEFLPLKPKVFKYEIAVQFQWTFKKIASYRTPSRGELQWEESLQAEQQRRVWPRKGEKWNQSFQPPPPIAQTGHQQN